MSTSDIQRLLDELKTQIKQLSTELKEVSDEMRQHQFTEYPIFVAHQENAQIGEMLFDRTEYVFPYSINASTMERLIELTVLNASKVEDFKKAFGDPNKNMCIFWISGENTRFVFMPFNSTAKSK
jgi:hypothetical protein